MHVSHAVLLQELRELNDIKEKLQMVPAYPERSRWLRSEEEHWSTRSSKAGVYQTTIQMTQPVVNAATAGQVTGVSTEALDSATAQLQDIIKDVQGVALPV
jgi:DNA phosphorothioation-dependent restriction protein DptG